ncbi:MAG TPA: hypothetical protein VGO47_13475 [Chlamydiales bacterium]|nr:hypothetical protein [Chlamydiales bacterium]
MLATQMSWIEITTPAPVLNTPHFNQVFGDSIPLSPLGHPLQFEFVALKHMQFKVLNKIWSNILQISWPQYSSSALYLDRRFCQDIARPNPLIHREFSTKTILTHMESRLGTPYVWGGNWAQGIPEMLLYYPPTKPLNKRMQTLWTLEGLDCSGLLFEATHGATPRNTSHLLQFGRSLIPNEPLEPLDMIFYPGHVLFVRDQKTIIESKSPFGVRICPLNERLAEISQEWGCQGDESSRFTIRRFIYPT